VALVDQADAPHPHAASSDRHRVVRALHCGNGVLTTAATCARQRWEGLENRLGMRLLRQVGALTAMPPQDVPTSLDLLAKAGATAQPLGPEQLATRYPHLKFPGGNAAVLETRAGVVLADRALAALVAWLRRQPDIQLRLGQRVVAVDPAGAVRLADGTALHGDHVVVAAGPWSRDLLPASLAASLTLYRQSTLYCRPWPSAKAWAGTPAIPALGSAEGAWLVPPVAGTPLRLSAASACRAVAEMDGHDTPPQWKDHLVDHFSGLLVGFDSGVVVGTRDCYYLADTVTNGPALVALNDGVVWHYAACGGLSFKFAPLIARALAQHASGTSPDPTGLDAVDHPQYASAVVTSGNSHQRGSP
jgi:glycine/D-amino acid oxidase-like deaminating enzyme